MHHPPALAPMPPPIMVLVRRLLPALCIALAGCADQAPLAVGTLEWDRVELVSEAAEPIVAIPARVGQTLAAGELILQLNPDRHAAALAAAEASRALAAARLAELTRGTRPEKLDDARARLRGAVDTLTVRQREFERVQSLLSRKLTSAEDADLARRLRDTATAERDRAAASLAELEHGSTSEELDQARATLAQAEATVAARRLDLDRLSVRAPQAGRLDDLPYRVGEQPAAGNVVAVLLAGARPYARVYVPAALRARVHPGAPATVAVDGLPAPLAGTVRRISADPAFTPFYALTERDRGRLTWLAEIDLTAPPPDLPAGLPLTARFGDGAEPTAAPSPARPPP